MQRNTVETVKFALYLPEDWLCAIEAYCKEHDLNFSAHVSAMAIAPLPESVKKNLSKRRPARRPRKDEL